MKLPNKVSKLADHPFLNKHRKLILVTASVTVLCLAYWIAGLGDQTSYLTAPVERGDIASIVTATGTLTPVGQVKVGSQLSGQIAELLVDFNDQVTKDQPLARLDAQGFEAAVREGEAALEIAEANMLVQEAALSKAESDLATARASRAVGTAETDNMRAQREEAARELERMQKLAQEAAISGSEVDRAQARARSAAALLRAAETQELVGDATTRGAEAAVKMALARLQNAVAEMKRTSAVLEKAKVDLERTTITAPIDGVVIERNVDSGQTVAASLQAPTLFTLANDLKNMEVHAQVDQADIGQIRPNQNARFAVDTYPDRLFTGTVTQIRKAPQVIQNIVTYTVLIAADNSELLLLPGMTAILQITVAEVRDVLKIPSAALRFRPMNSNVATDQVAAERTRSGPPEQGAPALVWVLDGGAIYPRMIGIGVRDSGAVQVMSGPLTAGENVVIGTAAVSEGSSLFGIRAGF